LALTSKYDVIDLGVPPHAEQKIKARLCFCVFYRHNRRWQR